MVFDAQGRVQYVQESAPTGDKKFTTATMYLVPFETITSFGQTLPQFNEEPGRCRFVCMCWSGVIACPVDVRFDSVQISRSAHSNLKPSVKPTTTTAIFTRLTTLTAESRSLGAGEHLICVYGDNWLSVRAGRLSFGVDRGDGLEGMNQPPIDDGRHDPATTSCHDRKRATR